MSHATGTSKAEYLLASNSISSTASKLVQQLQQCQKASKGL